MKIDISRGDKISQRYSISFESEAEARSMGLICEFSYGKIVDGPSEWLDFVFMDGCRGSAKYFYSSGHISLASHIMVRLEASKSLIKEEILHHPFFSDEARTLIEKVLEEV